MPPEGTKILQSNQYQISDKALYITYGELECLIEKIDECKSNLGNSSAAKVGENILSGFLISATSPLKIKENKHDVYRNKDCMKRFCEFLREHATKKTNFKKKKLSSRNIQKFVTFVKKNSKINILRIKIS